MVNLVVLVKSVPTKQEELINKLRVMENVNKVYPCYGRFDIVVFMDLPDINAVRLATLKINSMDGVRSTETLLEA